MASRDRSPARRCSVIEVEASPVPDEGVASWTTKFDLLLRPIVFDVFVRHEVAVGAVCVLPDHAAAPVLLRAQGVPGGFRIFRIELFLRVAVTDDRDDDFRDILRSRGIGTERPDLEGELGGLRPRDVVCQIV